VPVQPVPTAFAAEAVTVTANGPGVDGGEGVSVAVALTFSTPCGTAVYFVSTDAADALAAAVEAAALEARASAAGVAVVRKPGLIIPGEEKTT
jgi:hypothetical protein